MDIEKTVKEILLDILDVPDDKVVSEANIMNDLGASSVQIIDLVATVENEFDIRLTNDEIVQLRTVGDAVRFIESKLPE